MSRSYFRSSSIRFASAALVAAATAGNIGCGGGGGGGGDGGNGMVDVFSSAEWTKILTLSPLLSVPATRPETTNKYADNAAAATLGQRLYFEKGYSGPLTVGDDGTNGGLGQVGDTGKVSCASCHTPSTFFDDQRSNPDATSLGPIWTGRNTPSLVNVAFYEYYGWGGGFDTLWGGSAAIPESPNMGGSRLAVAHVVYAKYKDDYNAIFQPSLDPALDPAAADAARFPATGQPKSDPTAPDGPWEKMAPADQKIVLTIEANFGKAISAYMRLLVSPTSAFDNYVAGDTSAITAGAKRGLGLFIGKAACVSCHDTPFFASDFHDTSVPQVGPHVPAMDSGQYDDLIGLIASPWNSWGEYSDDLTAGKAIQTDLGMPTADKKGVFRTKNLRNLSKTGPYFHTGAMATLTDVVNFYNQGGSTTGYQGTKDPKIVPLDLSSSEIADLVEFLGTLTGDDVPAALTMDTSAP